METITVWILIALSGFNQSSPFTTTPIAVLPSREACVTLKKRIDQLGGTQKMECFDTPVVRGVQS